MCDLSQEFKGGSAYKDQYITLLEQRGKEVDDHFN